MMMEMMKMTIPKITETDLAKRKAIISFFQTYPAKNESFNIFEADTITLKVMIGNEKLIITQLDVIGYELRYDPIDNPLAEYCLNYFKIINNGSIPST